MGYVGTAIAQGHRRRGGVGDLAEQRRERWIDVPQQAAADVRLDRYDDAVGLDQRAFGTDDAPAAAAALDLVHALLQECRPGRQPRRERRDELLHAVLEGHEEAPAGPAGSVERRPAGRPPEPQDDGPVAPSSSRKRGIVAASDKSSGSAV